jgi:hypothetical protein
MICKGCACEYGLELCPHYIAFRGKDALPYGWHPELGECIWCYLLSRFGQAMKPWGNRSERRKQKYVITPDGVPSPMNYPDDDGVPANFEAEMQANLEMEKRQEAEFDAWWNGLTDEEQRKFEEEEKTRVISLKNPADDTPF